MRLIFLISLVILGGCYTKHPPYPGEWPGLKHPIDIESDIEGSFSCRGEMTHSGSGCTFKTLPDFFTCDNPDFKCNYVEFNKVSDGLEIIFMRDKEFISKKKTLFRKKDYKIENGWIKLESASSYLLHARLNVTLELTINNAGDLVLKANNSSTGVHGFFLIPFGAQGTDWGKFERILDTTKPDQLKLDAERGNTDSQPVSKFNLTGTYISEITSNSKWQLTRRYQNLKIKLRQKGNKITGFDEKYDTKIEASIAGDVVNFYVLAGQASGGYDIEGEWKISSDGTRLVGTWVSPNSADAAAGDWILRKVQ